MLSPINLLIISWVDLSGLALDPESRESKSLQSFVEQIDFSHQIIVMRSLSLASLFASTNKSAMRTNTKITVADTRLL